MSAPTGPGVRALRDVIECAYDILAGDARDVRAWSLDDTDEEAREARATRERWNLVYNVAAHADRALTEHHTRTHTFVTVTG